MIYFFNKIKILWTKMGFQFQSTLFNKSCKDTDKCWSLMWRAKKYSWISLYCNKCVLLLTHTLIFNLCVTTSMHGLHTSTQHHNETLEPLNWIRVRPSRCNEHSCKCSHVWYCVSCNIIKYTTFKPLRSPSFHIDIRSTDSHLNINLRIHRV